MEMGSYLAVLDTNKNVGRKRATIVCSKNPDKIGQEQHKVIWRKATKKRVARKVFVKKDYGYLNKHLCSVYKRAELGKR